MKRRQSFMWLGVVGLIAALPACQQVSAADHPQAAVEADGAPASPLKPPAHGVIPVAFLVSDGAVVIDFAGPWEVFQDVSLPGRDEGAFQLYTVAETRNPIRASGGLTIVPNYTFETAPLPKVLVIPAQGGKSDKTLDWIRRVSKTTDVTMSVCTGAFLLAQTGLLSGKSATTHHDGYKGLGVEFPDIHVKRGARFVEEGNLATAGGLSSGIDLALRVVERYFGREVVVKTAYDLEYQGTGWTNPASNQVYASVRVGTDSKPVCPVCEMEVDPKTAPNANYKGKTYYFCSKDHRDVFNGDAERFAKAASAE